MVSKRAYQDDFESSPKRRRNQPNRKPNSATDTTYGQRAVFGSLVDITTAPTGDSDLDCEDDSDALAYLRSVREQAGGIPHVLVATRAGPELPPANSASASDNPTKPATTQHQTVDRAIYEDGRGDFRGYYNDGAYIAYTQPPEDDHEWDEDDEDDDEDDEDDAVIASPSPSSSSAGPRNSSVDEIRDAYFASLTRRYLDLRRILQRSPPPNILAALPTSNPHCVGDFGGGSNTFVVWTGRIRGTDPMPAQVAGMHKSGVIRLLRVILGDKFLRKGHDLRERTSRWVWALLARLPDKGELDYQDIGYVRELGKRAVLLMLGLAELQALKESCDVDRNPEGEGEGEVDVDEGVEDEGAEEGGWGDEGEEDAEGQDGKTAEAPQVLQNGVNKTSKDKADDAVDDEESDVEMEVESEEDGEIHEQEETATTQPEKDAQAAPKPAGDDSATDIESMKRRLLAQLDDNAGADGEEGKEIPVSDPAAAPQQRLAAADDEEEEYDEYEDEQEEYQDEEEEEEEDIPLTEEEEAELRSQVNLRATLNMILTVAGEFYGQRDLLEFRDPFAGLAGWRSKFSSTVVEPTPPHI